MEFQFSDFAEDEDKNLGKANGKCFQRKQGNSANDGQIMVRLKKKRFIVIDYSIVPTAADMACAAVTPHLMIPEGAGMKKCIKSTCSKIGVPVCLYDSEPEEPISLYLRSGLCFSCQRESNEKRRTQRKRKPDKETEATVTEKKFKINGETLNLHPDAIIINGPIHGIKRHGPNYEYTEIVKDMQKVAVDIGVDSQQLGISCLHEMTQPFDVDTVYNKLYHDYAKGIFLLSQWKESYDAAAAARKEGVLLDDIVSAAAEAAGVEVVEQHSEINPLHSSFEEISEDAKISHVPI